MKTDALNNTLLIIDNDEQSLKPLLNSLEKLGYTVHSVSGCVRSLSKAVSIKPDLILLATMLKSQNGLEIGKALKSNLATKSIPIIYIKCPSDSIDSDTIFASGGVDFISKPVNISELNARIKFQLDLVENKKELCKQVSEREELFSILSHDLRKPFASLMGMTQLLAESAQFCTLDELKDLAKENHKTVKNTYHMLENLLEWCKVKSGQIEYKPTAMNLTDLIERVVYHSKEYALGKNISFKLDINSRAQVFADERMIYTVLKNLTDNAIKFSLPNSEVIVKQRLVSDLEEITIKDQGIGIKKNDQPKLFKISNPFTTPGTANEIGSGLGLILSKELIRKNGGELSYKSKYKAGSTFKVALPKIAM